MPSALKTLRTPVSLMLTAALLCSFVPPSAARAPEKVLKGKIIMSTKRFPSKFKSDKAFVKYMKKVDTKGIHAKKDGSWSFEYMVFARKPVGTIQAAVTFYDITGGGQKFVNTFNFYTTDKKDRIINGHASLSEEKNFKANRKYLMVFSRGYGQKALASTKFALLPAK